MGLQVIFFITRKTYIYFTGCDNLMSQPSLCLMYIMYQKNADLEKKRVWFGTLSNSLLSRWSPVAIVNEHTHLHVCASPTTWSWLPRLKSFDHIHQGLFLDFLFCSIFDRWNMSVLCQCHTVLIMIVLQ